MVDRVFFVWLAWDYLLSSGELRNGYGITPYLEVGDGLQTPFSIRNERDNSLVKY